ncbi:hypothetical protein Leryth_002421 [Lithospermum erythrorhizon]|nr:hypothetical protein Leryth_002421 [Lithospermum erythrorhizon]
MITTHSSHACILYELLSLKTSSKTPLLHFGHLGSSSESITYMRQFGHPTSSIDVASGLLEYCEEFPSWLGSEETQEL